jgi:hypothetical protein
MRERLGIELRRVGSGTRETFGPDGERVLSEWMARTMRVSVIEDDEPWVAEEAIIGALDLPLNIEHNAHNPQREVVREARRRCKAHARRLPILGVESDTWRVERHDDGPAGAWWEAVAENPRAAPGVVRDLLRDSRSVESGRVEAEQAVAWARAHPAWTDDPAPLVIVEPTPQG